MSIQCSPGSFPYFIKAGDTLFSLAQTFNTSVNAIIALNPGINPNSLIVASRICIPGTAPVTCPQGSTPYIIQRGDTLFALAQRFGTSVSSIIALNPGINPNSLIVGQRICIPGTAPVTCPQGSTAYIIRPGDTLFALAQRFGTSVSAIIALNPGLNPNTLIVGQRICIPGAAPVTCPPGSTTYIIRPGDTLFALAQRLGTSVSAIIALNPGLNPNALVVGQRICIPRGGGVPVVCPPGSFSYNIVSGDTLTGLAQRFGTSVSAIIALNPGINPNALIVGQTICIPQVTTTCPGNNFYTVRAGDTLFLIATQFDVSVGALLEFNPGLDPNRIIPGQRLCIPPQQSSCPGSTYVIEPGENLSSIAEEFGVSAADILLVNPRLRPSQFTPGVTICIPLQQAQV